MNDFVFHVEFEAKLSISVFRDKAIRHKNLEPELDKFLKKSTVLKVRCALFFWALRLQISAYSQQRKKNVRDV